MLTAPRTSVGSTFVLPGPRTYTYESLIKLVEAMTLKSHSAPMLPKPVAMAISTVLNRALWWPTISPDEVTRKYIDDVGAEIKPVEEGVPAGWETQEASGLASVSGVNGEAFKSWEDLNIDPETIEEHAIKYLRRYRSAYVSTSPCVVKLVHSSFLHYLSATFDAPVELGSFKAPKTYHVVE